MKTGLPDVSWYASGLKFLCKRCSACCRYDEGYVYLSKNDLDKLILFLDIDKDSFIGLYCRWVEDYKGNITLSLKEKSNKDCIFWDTNKGCTVYKERPIQCRMFPFWESIVSSEHNWKMASSGCPGMNNGNFYSEDKINGLVESVKKNSIIKKRKE